jgi:hypothetical protein
LGRSLDDEAKQTLTIKERIRMQTAKKCLLAAIAALLLPAGLSRAQSDAPYTEGAVWVMTMVKTKAGLEDDYIKNLSHAYRSVMDEAKKQGTILDYKILLGDVASPQDFDVMLMVEYKDMAALDGLRDKMDPIVKKVMGSVDQQRQANMKRGETREILGAKTMREITLK